MELRELQQRMAGHPCGGAARSTVWTRGTKSNPSGRSPNGLIGTSSHEVLRRSGRGVRRRSGWFFRRSMNRGSPC